MLSSLSELDDSVPPSSSSLVSLKSSVLPSFQSNPLKLHPHRLSLFLIIMFQPTYLVARIRALRLFLGFWPKLLGFPACSVACLCFSRGCPFPLTSLRPAFRLSLRDCTIVFRLFIAFASGCFSARARALHVMKGDSLYSIQPLRT